LSADQESHPLLNELPDRVVNGFKWAAQEGYRINFQHYDPEDAGHTPLGYGINVNSSICHFLRETFKDDPAVMIKEVRNSVEVYVGDYVFRPGKLGISQGEDVEISTARYRPTAHYMALENMSYVPPLEGVDWGKQTHYYIGHFGNPEDGCTAIYLCAPRLDWDSGEVDWEHCVPIFMEEPEVSVSRRSKVVEEPPPEIITDDISIELKDEDSGEAASEE
jgi:hypothetical protein